MSEEDKGIDVVLEEPKKADDSLPEVEIIDEKAAKKAEKEFDIAKEVRKRGGIDPEKASLAGYPKESFKGYGKGSVLKKGGQGIAGRCARAGIRHGFMDAASRGDSHKAADRRAVSPWACVEDPGCDGLVPATSCQACTSTRRGKG